MSAPKTSSAYLVTWSDEPAMPQGAVLIEKGIQLERRWDVMDFKTGVETAAVGRRLARLCGGCRNDHGVVGLEAHTGTCGTDEVKDQARLFIAAEKRQMQAVMG